MIFLPTLYPDELLYSVACRYCVRNCETSYKRTMHELFGSYNNVINYDLPVKLAHLSRPIKASIGLTPDVIAEDNTLYPYYTAFVSSDKSKVIFDMMKSDYTKESVRSKAGITASNIKANEYFKFCPECCKNDMQKYGEFYWHRIHQTPGVLICPEHGQYLQDSSIKLCSGVNKEIKQPNIHNCVNRMISIDLSLEEYEKLLNVSVSVKWLYKNYSYIRQKIGLWGGLHSRYIEFMVNKYPFCSKKKLNSIVLDGFKRFYGERVLKIIANNPIDDKYHWTKSLFSGEGSIHPIRHIMLILFLAGSMDAFFGSQNAVSVFGTGPWKCFNKTCTYYNMPHIATVDIKRYRQAGKTKLTGHFKCNFCGYEYKRGVFEGGSVSNPKLVKTGELLDNILKQVIANGDRVNYSLAKEIGINYDQLLNIVEKSRPEPTDKKNSHINFNMLKNTYQRQWLNLIAQNPGQSKSYFRKLNSKAYKWLQKNGRDWLDQNTPKYQNYKYGHEDYRVKDAFMLEKVRNAVDMIKNRDGIPLRITKTMLARLTGLSIIGKNRLQNFPNTEEYLSTVLESFEDFYIRKIDWAVKTINVKYSSLQAWRLEALLNFNKKYITDKIEKYIFESISNSK